MSTGWGPGVMPSDPEDIPPGQAPPPPPWESEALPDGWDDASADLEAPAAVPADVDFGRVASDVAQLLDEFAPEGTVGQHAAAIGFLTQTLEELLKAPPRSKPSPFSWAHTTGHTREQLWLELTGWVQRHNTRFGPSDSALHLVGCWYRHPVVVEELTALMEAWRTAYIGHQVPTTDAISYLQNYFHPTMHRIHTAVWGLKNCTGGHRDPTLYPDSNVFDPTAMDHYVALDLTAHPDPAPEPTSQSEGQEEQL
ncbi:hypothetical protein [Miniimonas sp. S16]|uniref:hypothetical protein n=1 Tax=Miniimonas sp. S16 TaxID=2171623 RepID=UPI000D527396|nr:hypothetical protein [Miniimonas sp. S16]